MGALGALGGAGKGAASGGTASAAGTAGAGSTAATSGLGALGAGSTAKSFGAGIGGPSEAWGVGTDPSSLADEGGMNFMIPPDLTGKKKGNENDASASLSNAVMPWLQKLQANQGIMDLQKDEMNIFKQRQKVIQLEFERNQKMKRFKAMMGGE